MSRNPTDPDAALETPEGREPESARAIMDELEREGYKRPARWKQAVPWVFTAAILWWVFKDIGFQDFTDALFKAKLYLLVPALLGFVAVYGVCDILSYGLCYRWFAAPDITVPEMAKARLGSYLLHVLYTPLSTVANIAYVRRVKGSPITWALSANAFTSVHDLFSANAVLTAALLLNLKLGAVPGMGASWLLPVSIPWLAAVGYGLYWFTGVRDLPALRRITESGILRSCRFAKARHHLIVLAARMTVALAGVASHAVALYAFGIEAPLPMVLVAAPLMIAVSIMPISGGGFGGPQLVAMVLLPYAGGDQAVVTAYSMAFSTLFLAGRSAIGAVFLPGYLRDARGSAPRMSADPVTGEVLDRRPGSKSGPKP